MRSPLGPPSRHSAAASTVAGRTPPALLNASDWLGALVVAVFASAVHWPVLSAQAVAFDDANYVLENPLVRAPSLASAWRFLSEVSRPSTVDGYYQPLTMISLMLDQSLAVGANEWRVHHRTSLVLHSVNAALLCIVLARLFGSTLAPVLVAMLFAAHPLTVEPVAWVSDRKTLLAAFFVLLSLACHLVSMGASPARRRIALGLSLAAFVAALLSKPTATPLPFVLLLLDVWPLGRWGRAALIEKLPMMIAALASAVITVISQRATAGLESTIAGGPLAQATIALFNLADGLIRVVVPLPAAVLHPLPDPAALTNPMIAWRVGLLVIAGVAAAIAWRRRPMWAVGAGVFALFALPTLGLVGFTHTALFDKFLYLPLLGAALPLTAMAAAWISDRSANGAPRTTRGSWRGAVMIAVGLLVLAGESVASRAAIATWRDSITLSDRMLAYAPRSGVLLNHRGWLLMKAGRHAEAEAALRRAIESEGRLVNARINLAAVLDLQERADEAGRLYEEVLAIRPNMPSARCNYATVLARRGRLQEAGGMLTELVAANPGYVEALANLGTVRSMQNRWPEAADAFSRAAALSPRDPRIHFMHGEALASMGRRPDAAAAYRRVLSLRPDDAEALARLSAVESVAPGG